MVSYFVCYNDFESEVIKMRYDYKKEFKELYHPKTTPSIIEVPKMNFVAIRGQGDPNEENGEYQQCLKLLYGIAYTLKMSPKQNYQIDGFFDYVVPPLEGFWWQEGVTGSIDYQNKAAFQFIALIRLPDFVKQEDFNWAKKQATLKKKLDFSKVEFLTYKEGLCVQCMHLGSYDDEPKTIELMNQSIQNLGYELDKNNTRYHHEIYLSDPRKQSISKLKTVIRQPIKRKDDHDE